MSWEHLGALYKMQPCWTSPQFVVLATIGNFADPITGRTPPLTYGWMARQTGMARSTAIEAANAVVQLGLVAREGARGERANVFRPLWTPIPSERRARAAPPATVREPDRESPAAGPQVQKYEVQNGVRGAAAPRTPPRAPMARMTALEAANAALRRRRR